MNNEPSTLGIAKPAMSLLLTACLLAIVWPAAAASPADAGLGATAAPAAVDLEPTATGPETPPCVKVYTDPPAVEAGECTPNNTTSQEDERPPCVKVYMDPPAVEVGECTPDA